MLGFSSYFLVSNTTTCSSVTFNANPASVQSFIRNERSVCSVCSARSNCGSSSVSYKSFIFAPSAISFAMMDSFAFSQLRLLYSPRSADEFGMDTPRTDTSDGKPLLSISSISNSPSSSVFSPASGSSQSVVTILARIVSPFSGNQLPCQSSSLSSKTISISSADPLITSL